MSALNSLRAWIGSIKCDFWVVTFYVIKIIWYFKELIVSRLEGSIPNFLRWYQGIQNWDIKIWFWGELTFNLMPILAFFRDGARLTESLHLSDTHAHIFNVTSVYCCLHKYEMKKNTWIHSHPDIFGGTVFWEFASLKSE